MLLLFLFSFLCHGSSRHDHLVETKRSLKYHLGLVTVTEDQKVVLGLSAYIRIYYIYSNYLFGPAGFIQEVCQPKILGHYWCSDTLLVLSQRPVKIPTIRWRQVRATYKLANPKLQMRPPFTCCSNRDLPCLCQHFQVSSSTILSATEANGSPGYISPVFRGFSAAGNHEVSFQEHLSQNLPRNLPASTD